MDKLRLRFRKVGRAIYISHLDLMQTMQRAFFRAECPLRYSEGFNPHPLLSIALPLSVGAASECEIMDFRLREDVDLATLPARLTAVLPEGIEILEAYEFTRKAAELKWLRVRGVLEYDARDAAAMAAALTVFYAQQQIVITKKTKRGMGETDIRPAIREIGFSVSGGDVLLEALISAQEPTLNPELLVEAPRQLRPEIAPDFAKFTRVETYDAQMQLFR